ncbi:MAG: UDP-N-acetylmuramate:L-alanyl-gamma-D-glutamyl-meso-diaminopimelate ligase, partial [Haliea sp.]|nr:UDP-N-acetylmuramate:L-alanyl-gamma-D-glutamyl-meso-diaminopimelate ligase [Haliea sp.]
TMRIGEHKESLVQCTRDADKVYWFQPPGMEWSLDAVVAASAAPAVVASDVRDLARQVAKEARPGDRVVIMSNGGFGGIHQILLDELTAVNS